MAKHADQPDQWTVAGVRRSYASKKHAEKVRNFLVKSPPAHIKNALEQGKHVDELLPSHLQRLPSWDQVHGVGVKESVMFGGLALIEALELAKESLECGCYEKMQMAVEALEAALYEDCPKGKHMHKEGCRELPPELHRDLEKHQAMQRMARTPEAHGKVHAALNDLSQRMIKAGFHGKGRELAVLSRAHKQASAS
jgi:hypothetical protein